MVQIGLHCFDEIVTGFNGLLEKYDAVGLEAPLLLALGGVVVLIEVFQFPRDAILAVLHIAELRTLEFKKEVVGILGLPTEICYGEIRIGVDKMLEVMLPPLEAQAVSVTKILESNVE